MLDFNKFRLSRKLEYCHIFSLIYLINKIHILFSNNKRTYNIK